MAASTRKRNPRGQGERLRSDLLAAATAAIAERGSVDGVGVRSVAAAVGVSPTAVYRHFASADELVNAAIDHCWAGFRDSMIEIAAQPKPALDRFQELGYFYLEFAQNEPGAYRVMFSQTAGPDDSVPGMQAFDGLVSLVGEVLAAKDDDRDPFFVAVQVHTWVHGIADLCSLHGKDEAKWPTGVELLHTIVQALDLD